MPPTKKGMAKQKYRFSFRKKLARVVKRTFFRRKYCVVCGDIIERIDDSSNDDFKNNDIWNKKKKCLECSKIKKAKNKQEKYCSLCGHKFHEFDESFKEMDWNSWYLCSKCKKVNLKIIYHIEELFCLGLADRVFQAFEEKDFSLQRKIILSDNLEEMVLEILELVEVFLRESTSIKNFDRNYQSSKCYLLNIVREEVFNLSSFLKKIMV